MTEKPARRRRDPEARIEEITSATERVIAVHGVEGLTHRAVAEEASIPLGATTYHFATKDDLIFTALRRSVERFADYLDDWTARHPDLTIDQLIMALTDALHASLDGGHDQQVLESELYLAALRRPRLRPLADRYIALSHDTIARYTDPVTATAAAAAISGLSLRATARSQPTTRAEIEDILRRILTPNPLLQSDDRDTERRTQ
ncbi:TetR/AcrR family transcriptional regulator [Nocardia sp. NPDC052566]|uniref:TetR/AcrR family transcriptional regulator n=1 Tax=Nocardia sp. NPDC052566 TaxID=3364330 RepID=UPI0037C81CFC